MKIDYIEILKMFCLNETESTVSGVRFDVVKPFYKDKYAAATNGHYLCYVDKKLVELPPPENGAKFPNITYVIPKGRLKRFTVPLSDITTSEELTEECDRCEGGVHECLCGDKHDCKDCDGTGKTDANIKIALDGKTFQYRYLTKIKKACEMAGLKQFVFHSDGEPNTQAKFTAGKLNFVLMPLRMDSHHIWPPDIIRDKK